MTADGEVLDAFILGICQPLEEFQGLCIAIIHRLDDNDDKLILVPGKKSFNDEEIMALTDFQEGYFKSVIIRES